MIKTSLVLAAFTALSASAFSTAIAQDNRTGRYAMHKTDDGFVRLDTETGAVSLCQKAGSAWSCKPMPGTDAASSAEVARLTRKNAELKAEVKRLDELLGLRGNRDKMARHNRHFKLPSEEDVDQALNYFERMLKKFQDRLKRLERKSSPPERQL